MMVKTITLFERGDQVSLGNFNPVDEAAGLRKEAAEIKGSDIEHMQRRDSKLKWAEILEGIDPDGIYEVLVNQCCDDGTLLIIANGEQISIPAMSARLAK